MIRLAYGLPGMGKTTLLHDLLREEQDSGYSFFVNDHEMGWGPDGIGWRNHAPSNLRVVGPADMDELDGIPAEEFPARIYVFRNVEADAILNLAVKKGNIVYVDDEIDFIARAKGWNESGLRIFVHQGRHALDENGEPQKLHVYGACRRPQNLHRDLTDLADEVYVFRVQGSATLKRISDDSIIEPDEEEAVRNLEKFHCLMWKRGEKSWVAIKPIG